MFLPLLGERVGVRGNRILAVLAASALDYAPDDRPKGRMALIHSSFQASGQRGLFQETVHNLSSNSECSRME
jgi:hypothetical protein